MGLEFVGQLGAHQTLANAPWSTAITTLDMPEPGAQAGLVVVGDGSVRRETTRLHCQRLTQSARSDLLSNMGCSTRLISEGAEQPCGRCSTTRP